MRVPALVCVFPWGIPHLQSDWSLSCDHGLATMLRAFLTAVCSSPHVPNSDVSPTPSNLDCSCYDECVFLSSFFLLSHRLPYSFWTSRGHRCRLVSPPYVCVPSILSPSGFSVANARRSSLTFLGANSRSRAFREK